MEPAHYTDPLEDALSHGSQRVAQLASLTGAMAQVIWQRRALADARRAARSDQHALWVLGEQERLLHQQSRLAWAPAHDPQWLAHADQLQVAKAWAAAAASADADPSAKAARRKCEDMLRKLHPYAMAHYDRLRAGGVDPLDAMREAAPLFAYAPTARPGAPAPVRRALATSDGQDGSLAADGTGPSAPDPQSGTDDVDPAELRGERIVSRLQARVRASGRPELGPDELAVVLETVTNLPSDMIGRLAQRPGAELRAHTSANQSAAQLAAQSFPHTAAEAVQRGATRDKQTASTLKRPQAAHKAKRQSRSL